MCLNACVLQEKRRIGACNIFIKPRPWFPVAQLRDVFRHLIVTQDLIIENNHTTEEEDTHTWVLKSWVGSLGASSMILSMLDTYLSKRHEQKDMKQFLYIQDITVNGEQL